jgi:glycosyltransferase involved in cell wall biosynthesis
VLVASEDVGGLAAAIESLLADPARARVMGLAGRALVEREFSVDQMVEGNLEVYREALADR